MVSITAIIFMVITLVISLILPIVLFIIYAVKNKGKGIVSAWFLGAAGFFVLQMLIRIPIISVLTILPGFLTFVEQNYVLYVLLLGFSAGLFEVIGRFAVAKIMSKNLTYERGIAAGLGHGGIEAMLLVGMTYINNLLYTMMINGGTFDAMVQQTAALGVNVSSLHTVKASLLNTAPYIFGLAGYERVLTMICHTAMSLLVCYFVAKKQTLKGVWISLVLHTILDTASGLIDGLSTPYMGSVISQNTSYVLIYSFLTIVAVVCVFIIRGLKKSFVSE